MDKREVFKRGYDSGGALSSNDRNCQFDVLGERIEKLKKEISATKSCYDYVLNEMITESESIKRMLDWNEKRLSLLSELVNKNNITCNKLNLAYEEMFDIIKCNFETQNK